MWKAISNGLKGKCPRCGETSIFETWVKMVSSCASCELPIQSREPNCWFFMYMSTAFLTGFFILAMLWVTPENLWLGRFLVVLGAAVVFFSTMKMRKGIAIALDYWLEQRDILSKSDQ